jgi:hypothetical protein
VTTKSVAGVALICTLFATAGLSASGHQPATGRPAADTSSRVIRTLPPVRFGAPAETQLTFKPSVRLWSVGAARRSAVRRAPGKTQTICGLTMVEQLPDVDARMLLPPKKNSGAAVRRIEPQACTADKKR